LERGDPNYDAGTVAVCSKVSTGGTNWNVVTNGLPALPIAALAIDPVSPSTLYVGPSIPSQELMRSSPSSARI